jgi:hypothetical protein
MPEMRVCARPGCGVEFEDKVSRNGRRRTFCTDSCNHKVIYNDGKRKAAVELRRSQTKVCSNPLCAITFKPIDGHFNAQNFCSRRCREQFYYHHRGGKEKAVAFARTPKMKAWKSAWDKKYRLRPDVRAKKRAAFKKWVNTPCGQIYMKQHENMEATKMQRRDYRAAKRLAIASAHLQLIALALNQELSQ